MNVLCVGAHAQVVAGNNPLLLLYLIHGSRVSRSNPELASMASLARLLVRENPCSSMFQGWNSR